MKSLFLILVSSFLISCNSSNCVRTEKSKAINYVLSENYELFFGVAGSVYAILYKDSIAIDTVWMYSDIHKIGLDSILYIRVRSNNTDECGDLKSSKTKMIVGDIKDLTLYNGCEFKFIKPPYFHTYFSSFNYRNNYLYYWGLNDFSIYACRFNIKTGDFDKIKFPGKEVETDFFGVLHPPKFVDSGILYESEIDSASWVIDYKFANIITKTERKIESAPIESIDTIR